MYHQKVEASPPTRAPFTVRTLIFDSFSNISLLIDIRVGSSLIKLVWRSIFSIQYILNLISNTGYVKYSVSDLVFRIIYLITSIIIYSVSFESRTKQKKTKCQILNKMSDNLTRTLSHTLTHTPKSNRYPKSYQNHTLKSNYNRAAWKVITFFIKTL